jgi:hypothetical protein
MWHLFVIERNARRQGPRASRSGSMGAVHTALRIARRGAFAHPSMSGRRVRLPQPVEFACRAGEEFGFLAVPALELIAR